jgi:hypothetical protein
MVEWELFLSEMVPIRDKRLLTWVKKFRLVSLRQEQFEPDLEKNSTVRNYL